MSGISRVGGNAFAILLSDGTNKAATFALYALVARHLGTLEFAQLSLALTLLYTFQVFSLAGFKTFIAREIAKDKAKTELYLVNGAAIILATSLLSIVTLLLFTRLMNYERETVTITFLLSFSLLPYALSSLCEAVFQAWEKMHYTAYINVPLNVCTAITVFVLLTYGYGLYHIAILLLVASVFSLCSKGWVVVRKITQLRPHIDLHIAQSMARSAFTFLATDGFIVIWGSLNFILLSKLGEKTDVGLYNAATQVIAPVTMIYQGILASLFPIMCRRFELHTSTLQPITENLTELLLIFALPTAIGLFFFADWVFLNLYGNTDFLLSSKVLRIIVWTVITTALIDILGQVFIASLQETFRFRITVINTTLTFVLGLILISQFGLLGAALTSLTVGIINFLQHYLPLSELLPWRSLCRLSWKPVTASFCMILYLTMEEGQKGLFAVIPAGSIYLATLVILAIWSSGGIHQFKVRYIHGWSQEHS